MPVSERLRRLGKVGALVGFGFGVFLVVFYLTLPYGRFRDYLATKVSTYGFELEAKEAGPSLGLGMTMRDISLVSRPSGGGKPARILVDKAKLTVSLLSYLLGKQAYGVSAEAFGGEIETAVKIGKAATSVDASASEIDLAEIPWVKSLLNLPASGRFSAKLDLATPKQRLSESKGSLQWGCKACALGDGKAKLTIASNPMLAEGLGLPKIRLGDFTGKVAIDKGVGHLQNVQFKSQDLEATVEGEVHLAQPVASSHVDLYVRFKLSDSLLRSSEKLRTIMDLTTQMGKRSDGFLGLRLTGSFSHMGNVQWLKTSPFVNAAAPAKPPYKGPAVPAPPRPSAGPHPPAAVAAAPQPLPSSPPNPAELTPQEIAPPPPPPPPLPPPTPDPLPAPPPSPPPPAIAPTEPPPPPAAAPTTAPAPAEGTAAAATTVAGAGSAPPAPPAAPAPTTATSTEPSAEGELK